VLWPQNPAGEHRKGNPLCRKTMRNCAPLWFCGARMNLLRASDIRSWARDGQMGLRRPRRKWGPAGQRNGGGGQKVGRGGKKDQIRGREEQAQKGGGSPYWGTANFQDPRTSRTWDRVKAAGMFFGWAGRLFPMELPGAACSPFRNRSFVERGRNPNNCSIRQPCWGEWGNRRQRKC